MHARTMVVMFKRFSLNGLKHSESTKHDQSTEFFMGKSPVGWPQFDLP